MKVALQVLKKVGPLLFFLTVIALFADQKITGLMESELRNPEGTTSWIWFYGLLSLILSLIYPLLSLNLILASLKLENPFNFFRKNFAFMMKEQMRVWGKIMSWSLVFILPGIYKFVRYLMVPFVVCLDPAYAQGERDALEASERITDGKLLKLLGWVFLFAVAFPVMLTVFDDYKSFSESPLTAVLICFVEMLLNLSFAIVLWKIFRRSFDGEPHFSVERH